MEGIHAPLVSFSATEVGRMAGRAMLERGHRRAAFFAFQRAGLGSRYESGLREGLSEGGGKLPVELVHYDDSPKLTAAHEDFLKTNLERSLRAKNRPTAIFCPFDSEAESVYLTRRLSAVTVDEEELGQHAARLLEQMRRREKPLDDATEIIMPLSWAAGETLGPCPRKEAIAA